MYFSNLTPSKGIVFQDLMAYGCSGTATDVGYGLDLCLGPGTGAEWINPVQQTGDCVTTSDPLVAGCRLDNENVLPCDYGSVSANSFAPAVLLPPSYDTLD
jgi:hypothetical protein